MDIPDDILIEASRGDLQAFQTVYKTASSFVYNVAYRVVGHKEDAEEVTQEVFINVYHKLKQFRFESSFKTWLYRVTFNTAVNYAKKISKDRNRTVEYDENLTPVSQPEEVRKDMDRPAQQAAVDKLLNLLNPDQRACVVLRNIEGLSYQEIAQTLNVNLNTVRTRLKRAREALMVFKSEVLNHEL